MATPQSQPENALRVTHTFAAPRERVLTDTSALLRGLADKKLLEL